MEVEDEERNDRPDMISLPPDAPSKKEIITSHVTSESEPALWIRSRNEALEKPAPIPSQPRRKTQQTREREREAKKDRQQVRPSHATRETRYRDALLYACRISAGMCGRTVVRSRHTHAANCRGLQRNLRRRLQLWLYLQELRWLEGPDLLPSSQRPGLRTASQLGKVRPQQHLRDHEEPAGAAAIVWKQVRVLRSPSDTSHSLCLGLGYRTPPPKGDQRSPSSPPPFPTSDLQMTYGTLLMRTLSMPGSEPCCLSERSCRSPSSAYFAAAAATVEDTTRPLGPAASAG